MEKFQSPYKAHRSTETVMFNIDRDDGTLLVLLDLSAAFNTIDHQILFHILEHSLDITDSALMKSYLDGHQQCVQIEGVISEFAELACGVHQGSVHSCMFLLICLTLIIILAVFVNQLIFICVTLVAFVIFYLMMHVPN